MCPLDVAYHKPSSPDASKATFPQRALFYKRVSNTTPG